MLHITPHPHHHLPLLYLYLYSRLSRLANLTPSTSIFWVGDRYISHGASQRCSLQTIRFHLQQHNRNDRPLHTCCYHPTESARDNTTHIIEASSTTTINVTTTTINIPGRAILWSCSACQGAGLTPLRARPALGRHRSGGCAEPSKALSSVQPAKCQR